MTNGAESERADVLAYLRWRRENNGKTSAAQLADAEQLTAWRIRAALLDALILSFEDGVHRDMSRGPWGHAEPRLCLDLGHTDCAICEGARESKRHTGPT